MPKLFFFLSLGLPSLFQLFDFDVVFFFFFFYFVGVIFPIMMNRTVVHVYSTVKSLYQILSNRIVLRKES
jgi:hypothetical protein